MTQPLDAHQLEQLVRAVVEEVLGYLGTGSGALGVAGELGQNTSLVIDAGAGRVSMGIGIAELPRTLAALIDHTLLKPEASRSEIERLCHEAVRFGFASVCVNPWYVPLAAELTRGSTVKVCTVVGFPLGATLTPVKIFEAEEAVKLGAQEIDVVQNIGALKSAQDEQVEADVRAVVEAAHRGGAICKVILETAFLTTEEKVRASLAAMRAGADFIKTSTGFGPAGATAEDVALIRAMVGKQAGIKAAGGIRSLEDLQRMVSAGATRIGSSASVRILEQAAGLASSGSA